MPVQLIPVRSKRPAAKAAARKGARAAIARHHSHAEKITAIAGAVIAVALVVAGLTYQFKTAPAPPAQQAVTHPFVHGRNARIVIPTSEGDGLCREHAFDNDRGIFGEPREIPCREDTPRGMRGGEQGFSNFKQAFGGKK